jgi:hypothetical protein
METGFGHFLAFGPSELLHIACFDTAKCSSQFGSAMTLALHDQVCKQGH